MADVRTSTKVLTRILYGSDNIFYTLILHKTPNLSSSLLSKNLQRENMNNL